MCDVTTWIYMVCELRYNGGFSGYQVALARYISIFERCHNVCLNGFSRVRSSPGFCGTTETGVRVWLRHEFPGLRHNMH